MAHRQVTTGNTSSGIRMTSAPNDYIGSFARGAEAPVARTRLASMLRWLRSASWCKVQGKILLYADLPNTVPTGCVRHFVRRVPCPTRGSGRIRHPQRRARCFRDPRFQCVSASGIRRSPTCCGHIVQVRHHQRRFCGLAYRQTLRATTHSARCHPNSLPLLQFFFSQF